MSTHNVPSLADSNVVIRLATGSGEIEAANELVYRNYINLYWKEDKTILLKNKYLNSPARHVAVAVESSEVVATMSAVEDSVDGLPSDTFQPNILKSFRADKGRIAEMTAFAVNRGSRHSQVLSLYLMKFFMQYSFYYLGLDRLVASCRPRHASFYADRLCFKKYCDPLPHSYAGGVKCQLVALDLLEAHSLLSDRYEAMDRQENFYRFLYIDEDPKVRFPQNKSQCRSRHANWAAIARRLACADSRFDLGQLMKPRIAEREPAVAF